MTLALREVGFLYMKEKRRGFPSIRKSMCKGAEGGKSVVFQGHNNGSRGQPLESGEAKQQYVPVTSDFCGVDWLCHAGHVTSPLVADCAMDIY